MLAQDWDKYWNRPYARYEKHQQWFWDSVYPYLFGAILDIGCGSASMWKGHNYDVTGIDYSASAIAEAKRNYPQGTFSQADLVTFVPDREFDCVISCGVVHYFYPRLDKVRQAHLAANPKRIIITLNTPVDLNLFKDWGKLIAASFKDRVGWVLVLERFA